AAAHEGDVNGQKRLLSAAAFAEPSAEAASIRCCLWQSLLQVSQDGRSRVRSDGVGDVLMGEAVRGCMQAAAHEGDVNGQKRLLSAAAFGRAFCRSGFYPLLPLAEPSAEAASIRCCLWQSLLQAAAHEGDVNGQKRLLSAAAFGRAFCRLQRMRGCEWAEAASIRCCLWQSLLQVSQDGRSRVRSDGVGDVLMGEAVRGCMQAAAHEGDVNGQKRLLSAAAFGRAFCRSGFYPLLPLAEPSAGCMQAAAHEGDVNGQKRLLSAAAFGRAFCRSGFYPLLPLAEPSAEAASIRCCLWQSLLQVSQDGRSRVRSDGVGDVLMGEAVRGCMQAAAHEGDVNGQKRLLSAAAFGRAFCRSGFYPLLPLAEPSAEAASIRCCLWQSLLQVSQDGRSRVRSDGVGDVLMGEAVRGCMQAAAHEGDVNGQKRLLSAAAFGRAFCRSGFYPLLPLAEPSAEAASIRCCLWQSLLQVSQDGRSRVRSDGVGDVLMGEAVRGCMQAAAHEGDVNGQKRLLSAAAFGRAFCRSGFYPLLPLAEPSAEAASIRCCLWQSLLQVSQDGRSRVRSDGVGDVLMGEAVRGCMQAAAHEGDVNGQKRLLSAAAFGRAFCRSGFYPLLPLAEPSAEAASIRCCLWQSLLQVSQDGRSRVRSDGVGDVLMGEAVRGCMQAAAHEGDVNGQKRLLSAAAFGRAFCRSGFYPLLPLAEPSAEAASIRCCLWQSLLQVSQDGRSRVRSDGVGDVLMGEAVRGCMQAAAHEGDVNGQKRLLSAAAFGRAFCRSGFYPLLPLAEPSAEAASIRCCLWQSLLQVSQDGRSRVRSDGVGDVLMGEAVRGCMQAAAHEGDVNGQKRLLSAAAFGRAFCRSGFYPLLPLAEPSAEAASIRCCLWQSLLQVSQDGRSRVRSDGVGDVLMGEAVRGCMQAAAHEGDVNGQKRLLSAAAFGRAFCRSGFYPLLPLAEPSAEAASIRCCLWQSLLQVSQDGRSRVRSDGVGDVLMGEAVRGCMQAAAHEGDVNGQKRLLSAAAFGRAFCRSGFYPLLPLAEPSAEAASIRCCLWQSLLQVSQDGRSRVRSDGVGDVLMGEAVRGCMQAAAHEGDVNGQKRLLSAAAFGRAFCRSGFYPLLPLAEPSAEAASIRCCLWQSLLQVSQDGRSRVRSDGVGDVLMGEAVRGCMQAAAHEGDVNGQKRLLSAAAFGRAFCRSGFYPLLPLAEPSAEAASIRCCLWQSLLQVSQDGRSRVRSDGVGDVLMGEAVRGCMQAAAHEGDVNGQKRLLSAAAFGRAFCRSGFYPLLPLAEPSAEAASIRCCLWQSLLQVSQDGRSRVRSDGVGDVLMGEAVRGCMQAAAHEGDVNGQKRLLSAAAFGRAFCRSGFYPLLPLAEPSAEAASIRCCLWQSLLQVSQDGRSRVRSDGVGDVLMGEAVRGCMQAAAHEGDVNGQKRLLSAAAFGRAFCRSGFYPLLPLAEPSAEAASIRCCLWQSLLQVSQDGRSRVRSDGVGDVLMGEAVRGCMQAAAHEGDVNGQKRLLSAAAFGRAFCRSGFYPLLPLAEPSAEAASIRCCLWQSLLQVSQDGRSRVRSDGVGDVLMGEAVRGCMQAAAHEGDVNGQKRLLSAAAFGRAFCRSGFYPLLPLAEPSAEAASIRCCLWQSLLQVSQDGRSRVRSDGVGDVLMGEAVRGCMQAAAHEGDVNGQKRLLSAAAFGRAFCRSGFYPLLPLAEPSAEAASIRCCLWQSLLQVSQDGRSRVRSDGVGDVLMGEAVRGCMQAAAHEGDVNGQKRLLSAAAFGRAFCRSGFYPLLPLAEPSAEAASIRCCLWQSLLQVSQDGRSRVRSDGVGDVLMGEAVRGCMQAAAHEGDVNGQKRLLSAAAFGRAFCRSGFYPLLPLAEPSAEAASIRCCLWQSLLQVSQDGRSRVRSDGVGDVLMGEAVRGCMQAAAHEGDVNGQKRLLSAAAFGRAFCRSGFYPLLPLAEPSAEAASIRCCLWQSLLQVSQDGRSRVRSDGVGDVLMGEAVRGCMQAAAHEGDVNGQKRLLSAAAFGRAFCRSGFYPLLPLAEPSAEAASIRCCLWQSLLQVSQDGRSRVRSDGVGDVLMGEAVRGCMQAAAHEGDVNGQKRLLSAAAFGRAFCRSGFYPLLPLAEPSAEAASIRCCLWQSLLQVSQDGRSRVRSDGVGDVLMGEAVRGCMQAAAHEGDVNGQKRLLSAAAFGRAFCRSGFYPLLPLAEPSAEAASIRCCLWQSLLQVSQDGRSRVRSDGVGDVLMGEAVRGCMQAAAHEGDVNGQKRLLSAAAFGRAFCRSGFYPLLPLAEPSAEAASIRCCLWQSLLQVSQDGRSRVRSDGVGDVLMGEAVRGCMQAAAHEGDVNGQKRLLSAAAFGRAFCRSGFYPLLPLAEPSAEAASIRCCLWQSLLQVSQDGRSRVRSDGVGDVLMGEAVRGCMQAAAHEGDVNGQKRLLSAAAFGRAFCRSGFYPLLPLAEPSAEAASIRCCLWQSLLQVSQDGRSRVRSDGVGDVLMGEAVRGCMQAAAHEGDVNGQKRLLSAAAFGRAFCRSGFYPLLPLAEPSAEAASIRCCLWQSLLQVSQDGRSRVRSDGVGDVLMGEAVRGCMQAAAHEGDVNGQKRLLSAAAFGRAFCRSGFYPLLPLAEPSAEAASIRCCLWQSLLQVSQDGRSRVRSDGVGDVLMGEAVRGCMQAAAHEGDVNGQKRLLSAAAFGRAFCRSGFYPLLPLAEPSAEAASIRCCLWQSLLQVSQDGRSRVRSDGVGDVLMGEAVRGCMQAAAHEGDVNGQKRLLSAAAFGRAFCRSGFYPLLPLAEPSAEAASIRCCLWQSLLQVSQDGRSRVRSDGVGDVLMGEAVRGCMQAAAHEGDVNGQKRLLSAAAFGRAFCRSGFYPLLPLAEPSAEAASIRCCLWQSLLQVSQDGRSRVRSDGVGDVLMGEAVRGCMQAAAHEGDVNGQKRLLSAAAFGRAFCRSGFYPLLPLAEPSAEAASIRCCLWQSLLQVSQDGRSRVRSDGVGDVLMGEAVRGCMQAAAHEGDVNGQKRLLSAAAFGRAFCRSGFYPLLPLAEPSAEAASIRCCLWQSLLQVSQDGRSRVRSDGVGDVLMGEAVRGCMQAAAHEGDVNGQKRLLSAAAFGRAFCRSGFYPLLPLAEPSAEAASIRCCLWQSLLQVSQDGRSRVRSDGVGDVLMGEAVRGCMQAAAHEGDVNGQKRLLSAAAFGRAFCRSGFYPLLPLAEPSAEAASIRCCLWQSLLQVSQDGRSRVRSDGVGDVLMGEAVRGCMQAAAHEGDVNGQKRLLSAAAFGRAFCRSGFYPLLPLAEPSAEAASIRCCLWQSLLQVSQDGRSRVRSDGVGDVLMGEAVRGCMQAAAHEGDVNGQKRLLSAAAFGRAFCRSGFYPLLPLAEPSAEAASIRCCLWQSLLQVSQDGRSRVRSDGVGDVLMGEAVRGCMQAAAHEGDVNGQKRLLSAAAFGRAFCRSGFYPLLPLAEPSAEAASIRCCLWQSLLQVSQDGRSRVRSDGVGDVLMGEAVRGCMQAAAHEGDVNGQKRLLSAAAFGRAFCRSGFYPLLPLAEPSAEAASIRCCLWQSLLQVSQDGRSRVRSDGVGDVLMGEAVRGCMQAAAHEGDVNGQKRLLSAAAFGRAFCRSGFYPLLPLAEPSAEAASIRCCLWQSLLQVSQDGRSRVRSDGVGDVLMGEAVRGCMQAAAHEGDVNGQKRLLSAAAFGRAFCRSGFYPLLPLAEPSAEAASIRCCLWQSLLQVSQDGRSRVRSDGVGDVLMGEAVRGCMQAAAHEGDVNGQKRLLSAAAFGRAFCRSGFYPLLPLAEPSAEAASIRCCLWQSLLQVSQDGRSRVRSDGVGDVLMGEAVRGCMQAAAHEGDVNGQKRLLSAAAFGRAFCRSGFYPLLPLAEPSAEAASIRCCLWQSLLQVSQDGRSRVRSDGVGDVLMGEAVRGCMQAAAHEGDVNGQKRLLSAAAFGRAFCRSGFYPLLPLAEPSAEAASIRCCLWQSLLQVSQDGRSRVRSDGVGDVLMGEAVRGCMQAAAHEGDVNGQKRLLSAAAFGRAFCRSGFYPLLPLAEPSAEAASIRCCLWQSLLQVSQDGRSRVRSDGVGDVLMGEAVRGCMQAAAHEGDVNGQKRLLSAAAFGRAFCRSGFYPLLPLAEPSAEAASIRCCLWQSLLQVSQDGRSRVRSDGVGDVLMGEAVRGCMQAAAHEGDVNGQKRLLSAAAFGRAFCRSGFYPLLPLAEPSAEAASIRCCLWQSLLQVSQDGRSRVRSDGVGDVLMGEAVRGCMQAAAHEGDVNGQKRLLSAAAFGRAFCRSGFYPLLPLAEPSAEAASIRCCLWQSLLQVSQDGRSRVRSDGVGDVLMGEAVRGCMQAAAHEGDVNGQKRLLSAAAFGRAFCRSGFYPLLPLAEPSAEAASIRCCLWQSLLQVSQDGRSRVRSDGVGDVLMGEAVRGCMQAAAHEGDVNGQKRLLSAAAFGRAFCRSGFYPLLPLAEPSAEAASIRCCLWQSLLQVSQDGRSRVRSDGVGDVLMGEAVRGCMQAAAHEGDVNGQKRLLSAAAFGRAFCRSGFYPLLPLAEPSAEAASIRCCLWQSLLQVSQDGRSRVRSDGVGDVLMGEAVRGCMQAAAHEGDVNGQKRLLSAAAFGRAFCRKFPRDRMMSLCKDLRVLNAVRRAEEDGLTNGVRAMETAGMPLTYSQYKRWDAVLDAVRRAEEDGFTNGVRAMVTAGMPLTYSQYKELSPARLIARLCSTHHHLLALRVAAFLGLRTIDTDKRGSLAVSFAAVATVAFHTGRHELATRLLEREVHTGRQVRLLLEMGAFEAALWKAEAGPDADFVFQVLFQLLDKAPEEQVFELLKSHPTARSLFISYCKKSDIPLLMRFYERSSMHQCVAEQIVKQGVQEGLNRWGAERVRELEAAAELLSRTRDHGFQAKAVEDSVKLLRFQQQLEAAGVHLAAPTTTATATGAGEGMGIGEEEGRRRSVVGASVNDTIAACLAAGNHREAQKLKSEFKVPERRYYWLRLQALARLRDWEGLEKLFKERRPLVGLRAFVEACVEQGAVVEAAKYVGRIGDASEREELSRRLNLPDMTSEAAAAAAAERGEGAILGTLRSFAAAGSAAGAAAVAANPTASSFFGFGSLSFSGRGEG
ncbi:unnamed protein product, partial [Closterium sp. Naga37s-1]